MDLVAPQSPLSQFKPPQAAGSALRKFAEDTGDSSASLSSDFETFLKMLTVQLQNQDPLNPVDSSDYAVQLATFSAVEQQVLTNDLLTDLIGKVGGSTIQELASWVGMQALAREPASFDGAPITLRPEYEQGAQSAQLVVRDGFGNVVQQLSLPVGEAQVEWAGVTDTGVPLPTGLYRFDVDSFSADGTLIGTRQAMTYNTVAEARVEDGDVVLVLDGGTELLADLVSGLRAPR